MKKLILFELRKVFSKRLSLIVLVGILLFSVLISFSTYQNKYAFDGVSAEGSGKTAVEIDKEIAAKYEGILTDEKVQQMMNDFAPTHDLHGLNAMYLYQNATQSAAFSRFSDKEGNWNGLSVSDVFGNEEIKIGYVDGWLSTSKNMVRVFIALALAVIIMLAPIFSGEYEGVDNIILTSKYGKTKCATAKVVAGILTAILTTALIVAFNLFLARAFYGTEGLNCSILFAPSEYVEAFIPFNITCGTLLKYQILLAFTCTPVSYTHLKLPGWEKAARMDSLGEGYRLEDLQAVLSGKKAHIPRKKTVTQAEPPKVNLLVDIQAKLQAGKGAGYARWAKVFNLKQMAQTMNYLSEHNLLEYAVLEEKAAAATAHHNELSAQIKAAEKRMAEIAVLRTHIVNYAKTREVYVAYRKAGYSKKFREEHELSLIHI